MRFLHRTVESFEDITRIPLRAKDGSIRAHALIDPEDANLAEHRWFLDSGGYAQRYIGRFDGRTRLLAMHRAILGLEFGDGLQADHINGDRLDNRRANLRIVTAAQNRQNRRPLKGSTSQYRGVFWNRQSRKWVGVAKTGDLYFRREFRSEEEAAAAASKWRSEHMSHTVEEAA